MKKGIMFRRGMLLILFGCCTVVLQSKDIGSHPFMGIININLRGEGEKCGEFVKSIVDVVICSRKILNELGNINSDENSFLGIKKKELIEPRMQFLESMYQNKELMRPLLLLSLEGTSSINIKQSLLIKFFDEGTLNKSFFLVEVNNLDKLRYICTELDIFISQLVENLSPLVVNEFLKYLKNPQNNLSKDEKMAYANWLNKWKENQDRLNQKSR